MATTWMKALHINKGKTIAQTITDRTDYAENPVKTAGGELVTGYGCETHTADMEFLLSKRQYKHITGRDQGRKDVLAYHIRQSFRPGEVTPEQANRIGRELALRFTKGDHAFIVATHIDKSHVHNHVVFNSTALNCSRKFEDFRGSAWAVRRLSDRICLEHGLSVIETPGPSRGHYGRWLGNDRPIPFKEKLRQGIEAALAEKPADFDAFLAAMQSAGFEIKRGKHLAFRGEGQQKFTRLRSMGEGYTEQAIRDRLAGKSPAAPRSIDPITGRVNLLIDIQARLQAGKGPGYEHWAKVFNLKEAAKTLLFLQENGITEYEFLAKESAAATAAYNDLSHRIKAKENRMAEINDLQRHIGHYNKTREVYRQWKASGYSKTFRAAHEGDILLHQAAKKAFDVLGVEKLPTIKELQTEYAGLLTEKKRLYREYRTARDRMRSLATAKQNTERILQMPVVAPEQEHPR